MTRVKAEPEHVDSLNRGAAGGRRKQSKPIRVYNIDTDVSNAPAGAAMADEAPADADTHDMDVDSAPASATDLAYEHDVMQNGDCNANSDVSAFPTKYHALGSVLLESSLGFNAQRLRQHEMERDDVSDRLDADDRSPSGSDASQIEKNDGGSTGMHFLQNTMIEHAVLKFKNLNLNFDVAFREII